MSKTKALVVLSGGQDSTTCLYWALAQYDEVHAITFDYGQRHRIELESAAIIAGLSGIEPYNYEMVSVRDLLKSTSPLTSDTPLDTYSDFDAMSQEVGDKVEKTFVPMRNTLFLTIAFNRAVAIGAQAVVTGICGEDNANYPDCTETFRRKLEQALNEGLHGYRENAKEINIEAPLMFLSKAETVKLADRLPGCMHALAYSHTSYDGRFPPTDKNHSNLLRAHGFEEAGLPDPLVLRAWSQGLMELPETANYHETVLKPFMIKHMPERKL